jgi:ferredoxin
MNRIVVNPITCVGHGLCAELFPEWIRLDDWGYPIIDPRPVPKKYMGHAKRAIAACPTLALMFREEAPAPEPVTPPASPRRPRARSGS